VIWWWIGITSEQWYNDTGGVNGGRESFISISRERERERDEEVRRFYKNALIF
jgi:hypothetical protein